MIKGHATEQGERSATFLIRINKKPNELWQGNGVWVSERCERTFSNMQELFQIMDSTLTDDEEDSSSLTE